MPFRILLLRVLAWLTAVVSAGIVVWQWQHGSYYPWPIVLCGVAYIVSAWAIAWKRLSWRDGLEKLGPSTLTIAILGLSFLLVESPLERWILSGLFIGTILLVLELLFLMTHDAARYPVNGLSRVNITLVPIGAFYLAFTMTGLLTFIRIAWIVPILSFACYAAFMFWFTCHPMADRAHRHRWLLLGGCIGAQVGLLTILLPVGMAVQGAIAAFLLAFPLRIRRYGFQPLPPTRLALAETVIGAGCFFCLLLVSRWA